MDRHRRMMKLMYHPRPLAKLIKLLQFERRSFSANCSWMIIPVLLRCVRQNSAARCSLSTAARTLKAFRSSAPSPVLSVDARMARGLGVRAGEKTARAAATNFLLRATHVGSGRVPEGALGEMENLMTSRAVTGLAFISD